MKRTVNDWVEEIHRETRLRESYRTRCKEIQQIYVSQETSIRDKDQVQFNILWSNTNTLLAALWAKDPKPDVRRRYRDENFVAKELAIAIERALYYVEDTTSFHENIKRAILNYLIGWPGVARSHYELYEKTENKVQTVYNTELGFLTEKGEPVAEDLEPQFDGESFFVESEETEFLHEEVFVEVVNGACFHWQPAEKWDDVGWCAISHYMTKEEVEKEFGKNVDVNYGYTAAGEEVDKKNNKVQGDRAKIWEVFDKWNKKVYMFCEGKTDYLEEIDDPWKLEGFYPFPAPLFPTIANSDGTPTPDYIYYQDLADDLNEVITRLSRLTEILKYRGLYDGAVKEVQNIENLQDGEFAPVDGVMQRLMAEGNSAKLENVFFMMPLQEAAATLSYLQTRKEELKQDIYEITGISDIVRGATKASETLGAQQLKAQFANLRLTNKIKDVERFCRDLFRITTDMIGQFFEPETIEQMTGIEITDEMVEMLQNDILRSYNVNVETDSTVLQDDQAEMQKRQEAITGIATMGQQLFPLVQAGVMTPDLFWETVMFGVRGIKGARELEESIQRMIDEQTNQEGPTEEEMISQQQAQAQEEQLMSLEMERLGLENAEKAQNLESKQVDDVVKVLGVNNGS